MNTRSAPAQSKGKCGGRLGERVRGRVKMGGVEGERGAMESVKGKRTGCATRMSGAVVSRGRGWGDPSPSPPPPPSPTPSPSPSPSPPRSSPPSTSPPHTCNSLLHSHVDHTPTSHLNTIAPTSHTHLPTTCTHDLTYHKLIIKERMRNPHTCHSLLHSHVAHTLEPNLPTHYTLTQHERVSE